jgi:DNA-binding IclR family transcriptional regulator
LNDKGKKIIQSVDKAFQILECFNNYEELGVTEISKMLDLHKSTTYGLISTLSANNILEKDDNTGKYRLGLKLYQLGTKVNFSIREIAYRYLEQLVSTYEETANLVILQNTSVVYLEKVESSHSMRISTLVGGDKPLYCTAVGKAMIAYLPHSILDELLNKIEFKKYTYNTIQNKESLLKSLEGVRKKGYAEDHEELEIGLHCIAAPIFNQYKIPFAAISVSGPVTRMNDSICMEIGNTLVKLAQEISEKLGYVR